MKMLSVKTKTVSPKVLAIAFCVFLLAVNSVLGTMLILQSGSALKEEMQDRMFDILNSASALLDGDVLETIEKDDYDTPEYQHALSVLRTFQQSFNLEYIYGIRDMGNKTFTFTIDPDPESPGEFGEPIQYTDALYSASLGVAAADDVPYEDRWGRFYSAYVPVFDSQGKVGGIIAVDVEAAWYEARQKEHIITTLIICVISLIAGGIIAFLLSERIHQRLAYLNSEMNELTEEVEELAQELRLASGRRKDSFEYDNMYFEEGDTYEELTERLKFLRSELHQYIDDAHELAYSDALTGAANRTAYVENINEIDKRIMDDDVDFSLAVFDINGLKWANDKYGHEFGDLLIISAADVLKEIVGDENLFRIGGDEFVAILDTTDTDYLGKLLASVDKKVAEVNLATKEFRSKTELAISKGYSCFIQGKDACVQSVFRRADDAMYADKKAYYQTHERRHL